MNLSLFGLNVFKGLVEMIRDLFDIIPKTIYFIYACLSSCVDAMQALVRKLAGLDVYYMKRGSSMNNWIGGNGLHSESAVVQQDPLTEFLYGILGYGDNKEVYRGLNTVFWSLAVFAVIMLVITTMIAIIKSHYNEDTAGTSPWKYIYQAIKAVLTFIAIPAVVLLGMKLNTFALSSLDKIFTGSGNDEELIAMFGTDATEIFEKGGLGVNIDDGDDVEQPHTYLRYDYFGWGAYTTATPFSGMLFKAAAHNCNRARTGDVTVAQYQTLTSKNDLQIFGSNNCQAFSSLTNDMDRQEYVAYQIDYAFANNLTLQRVISYTRLMDATDCSVTGLFDLFVFWRWVSCFSKFSPAIVWQFYNLWTFNYIVGFAGVFASFSMMISIIIGLMSRLIKGAALFLVYPALLGLAPLDNFKAFKSWGNQFMQQVLMAVGSIIGINLLLLILPFATSISFYNNGLLDAIINVIILITGLAMAKDFISMVSGFVGGADALSVGGGLKGDVWEKTKKGAGMTAKIGMTGIRAGVAGAGKILRNRRINHATADANAAHKKTKDAETEANSRQRTLDSSINYRNKYIDSNLSADERTSLNERMMDAEAAAEAEFLRSKGVDDARDLSDEDMNDLLEARREAANKAKSSFFDETAAKWDSENRGVDSSGNMTEWGKRQKLVQVAEEKRNTAHTDLEVAESEEARIVKKYGLKKKAGTDQYDELTKEEKDKLKGKGELKKAVGTFFFGDKKQAIPNLWERFKDDLEGAKLGAAMADSFIKTVKEMGSGMGVDKLVSDVKGIFSGTMKFDGTGWPVGGVSKDLNKLSGDDLTRKTAEQQATTNDQLKELIRVTKANSDAIKDLADRLGRSSGGS